MHLANRITTIVGKKGTGKTTHIKELLIKGKYQQIFVLDSLYEYRHFSSAVCCVSHDVRNVHDFCKTSWNNCRTDIKSVMIFDEVHLYGKNDKDIDFIYRAARHANLDVIASTQRFYNMPVIVRSQTDTFDVFQITEPNDLMYLEKFVAKGIVNTIRNLKVLQYVQLVI